MSERKAKKADHGPEALRHPEAVLVQIANSGIEIVPFLDEDAAMVALLSPLTHAQGLSLGVRACLALALTRNVPAMTADRAWARLDLGVPIQLIRGQSPP